jgi:hypothetical protein
VIAITGGYFVCLPAVELSAEAEIPFLTCSACGPYNVAETPSKFDMCTWALAGPGYPPIWEKDSWGEYGGDHLRMIRELKLPVKTVAILYSKVGILTKMAEKAREFYRRAGIDVVMYEGVDIGKPDWTTEILRLKEIKPDALIVQVIAKDQATLIRQMAELGYNPPLYYGGFAAPTPDYVLNSDNTLT